MPQKPDMTLAEALAKRQSLLDELNSEEHKERTETTYYGHHIPFDVPLVNCDSCNTPPQFGKVGTFNNRWNIACPSCNKMIQHPQSEPWKAQLLWWQRNLAGHTYQQLPLFSLATLDAPAARRRLAGIRRDLELKKALAEVEDLLSNITNVSHPGVEYRARLDAYMGWAMLALALLKKQDGGTQRLKREEYLAQKALS